MHLRIEREDQLLTVDVATTRTDTRPTSEHAVALGSRSSLAEKIRYACEQLPSAPTTAAVREWLAGHGVQPARSHVSSVVKAWREERDLPETGDLPKLTPELLAELDAAAGVADASGRVREPLTERSGMSDVDTHRSDATARTTTGLSDPHPDPHPDTPRTEPEQHQDVRIRTDASDQPSLPVSDRSRTSDLRQGLVREPNRHPRQDVRPRGWVVAWVSFVTGGLVSVAANVAHTLYPTPAQLEAWMSTGRPVDAWTPSPGAMAFAAFWPIALILSVEVLTRVSWRPGVLFGLARYGGTTIVAAVAAVMSYRHMSGLLTIWGEDTLGAHLGPLAVDGLMVIAASALLSMNRNKATNQA